MRWWHFLPLVAGLFALCFATVPASVSTDKPLCDLGRYVPGLTVSRQPKDA